MRIAHERSADGKHLLLTAGKLMSSIAMSCAKPREKFEDALDCPARRTRALTHLQVFDNRKRRENTPTLRHQAHSGTLDYVRRSAGYVVAGDGDRTLGWAKEPADGLDQCRLTNSVPS